MENFKYIFLGLYLLVFLFEAFLKYLNLRYLKRHGDEVPSGFEGQIDEELLKKTKNYILERSFFGYAEAIFDLLIVIIFIFGGILDLYGSWVGSLNMPFIARGVIFFLLLSVASTVLSIPFSLYLNFRIENKYGFNTMTYGLWIKDLLKSLGISIILTSFLTSAAFAIIILSPDLWWFWLWLFILVFGIFMMYVSPYLIEPLFHTFTPVQDEALVQKLRGLMEKVKIKISKVLVVDASKRSKHTNAYFTGIGRVKRIVLFDSLLQSMDGDEITAVCAHEAAHWKKKHILRKIVLVETISLVSLFAAYMVLESKVLAPLFGIRSDSFFVQLVLLGFVGSIVMFFFRPIGSFLSRRHEIEADRYACSLIENRRNLHDALIKLSKDNLSNLHPHPFYALVYYSHPPIQERLKKIISVS